jgi:hypothetical protein
MRQLCEIKLCLTVTKLHVMIPVYHLLVSYCLFLAQSARVMYITELSVCTPCLKRFTDKIAQYQQYLQQTSACL